MPKYISYFLVLCVLKTISYLFSHFSFRELLRYYRMHFYFSSLQYATLSYMSLYDALYIYGLAVRDAYEETKNVSVFLDGRFIWKKMTARQFIGEEFQGITVIFHDLQCTGSTGQVLMNNKAIRVPSYATYHVKNGTMRIVVELTARLGDKFKCAMWDNDCSEHVYLIYKIFS